MTQRANARVAGFMFLLYIAVGIGAMVLSSRAGGGPDIASQLAGMARHPSAVRVAAVLDLISAFCALALAASLYALTRDQDRDLALLAFTCRVAEGVIGGVSIQRSLGLLWLATATGVQAPDPATARGVAAFLLWGYGGSSILSATFFAVGSTLFSWLLLRGRSIPAGLAWLGLVASVLLVVALPLRIAGVLPGRVIEFLWLPMAAFEIPLAVWLLAKGVRVRAPAAA